MAHTFSFSINTRSYIIYCSPASSSLAASASLLLLLIPLMTGASFEGAGGRLLPKEKEKKKKRKKKKKKKEKERKKERKKGTMNNLKLLHIKCCFSNFSIVRWDWKKNWPPPEKKLKWRPCLMIVPSRLRLPLLLNWVRAIELNHHTSHWILVAVRDFKFFARSGNFDVKYAPGCIISESNLQKKNLERGLPGPLHNFYPRS